MTPHATTPWYMDKKTVFFHDCPDGWQINIIKEHCGPALSAINGRGYDYTVEVYRPRPTMRDSAGTILMAFSTHAAYAEALALANMHCLEHGETWGQG